LKEWKGISSIFCVPILSKAFVTKLNPLTYLYIGTLAHSLTKYFKLIKIRLNDLEDDSPNLLRMVAIVLRFKMNFAVMALLLKNKNERAGVEAISCKFILIHPF
jgi:hypothetical protein